MLKDNNDWTIIDAALKCYYDEVRFEANRRRNLVLPRDFDFGHDHSETPAKLVLKKVCPKETHNKIVKAMQDIKFTKIDVTVIDQFKDSGKLLLLQSFIMV